MTAMEVGRLGDDLATFEVGTGRLYVTIFVGLEDFADRHGVVVRRLAVRFSVGEIVGDGAVTLTANESGFKALPLGRVGDDPLAFHRVINEVRLRLEGGFE